MIVPTRQTARFANYTGVAASSAPGVRARFNIHFGIAPMQAAQKLRVRRRNRD